MTGPTAARYVRDRPDQFWPPYTRSMAANAEAGAGAAATDVARAAADAVPTTDPSVVPAAVVPAAVVPAAVVPAAVVPAGALPAAGTTSGTASVSAPGSTDVVSDGGQSIPSATDRPTENGSKPTRRQRIWRGTGRGIALLAVAITVMMIALAIGMRSNDSAIDDHLGTATATVLSVSPLRTGIEFVDATGATVRPEGGVLYPGLLSLGQQFVVEYSTQDPQIARVAGRTASVGTIMIALTLAGTYLVVAPLIWWCRRRSRLPLLAFRRDREPFGAAPEGTDRG
jgi:hypothetical protein